MLRPRAARLVSASATSRPPDSSAPTRAPADVTIHKTMCLMNEPYMTDGRAKRRLGATDIEITPVGLGCMQFAVYLRKGELSRGSTPLVERAVRLAEDLDRPIATVEEARADLGLT